VRKRFGIYRRHAKSLADYYRQQGKLTVVDAALSPDERFARTVAALIEKPYPEKRTRS